MTETNGYSEDRRLIAYRLEGLTTEVKGLREDVSGIKMALASKAALWGAVGSLPALVAAVVALIQLLK